MPRAAIIKEQNGQFVLKVTKDNLIDKAKIVLGQEHGAYQQIMSGLEKGDLVVTGGLQKVRPGIKVIPKVDTSIEESGRIDTAVPDKKSGKAVKKPEKDAKKASGGR
mgnify:FL=1